jgi:predicted metal-dependent peptidase
MKGYQLRQGIEAAAHRICSALGLPPVTITWSRISTAAINQHGSIMLANVADDEIVTQTLVNKYTGFVVHELLHRKYTNFHVNSDKSYVRSLHNAIEDAWIERSAIASGLTGNIEPLLKTLVDGMVDESLNKVQDWADPAVYPFALAVWARGFAKRTPVPANLHPVFDEAARRIDTCRDSADTLAVAEWVFSQLQIPPSQAPDQPESGDQDDGEGEDTPGEKTSESDGQDDGQPGDETSDDPEQSQVPGEDDQAMDVEPTLEPTGRGGEQYEYDKVNLVNRNHHLRDNPAKLQQLNSGKLRYEIRKLFENSGYDDWSINKKSGALNVNALHSVNTNVRVFKRHQEVEGIDSAVVILVDVSSSMEHRLPHARSAAAALYQTLTQAGVAVSVMAFDHHASIPVPFGLSVARGIDAISRIKLGGSTCDYFAIRMAHEMLLGRREQRKVVLSLTDGEGQPKQARQQVEIGERLGITTIGIGIQENVSRVYPNAIRIDDLSDLASASFKQIRLAA